MSADNWAKCPRCAKQREADFARRETEIAAAYGRIPVDEFDSLRADLGRDMSVALQPTFREDYEFCGAEEGAVTAYYKGRCNVCGLSLSFEVTRVLDVDGTS